MYTYVWIRHQLVHGREWLRDKVSAAKTRVGFALAGPALATVVEAGGHDLDSFAGAADQLGKEKTYSARTTIREARATIDESTQEHIKTVDKANQNILNAQDRLVEGRNLMRAATAVRRAEKHQ